MMIIKIAQEQAGFHVIESQSNRTENWMGDDWVEVPKNLEPSVLETLGWCNLTIENGVLTSITPTERPKEPPHTYTPLELTQQDITDRELDAIELGQSMTDLELMIMEGYHV